jgi:hypothetical protein
MLDKSETLILLVIFALAAALIVLPRIMGRGKSDPPEQK